MAYLKDLSSEVISPPFPQATFELTGEIPESQCSEARIESDAGATFGPPEKFLFEINKFIGWNLIGKVCHITASVGGNTGDFDITANTDHTINFLQDPGAGDPVTYYITDGGTLILTRNTESFAQFIHAAGYAYTFKGGKLYTNMPSDLLKNACTILFDPLT